MKELQLVVLPRYVERGLRDISMRTFVDVYFVNLEHFAAYNMHQRELRDVSQKEPAVSTPLTCTPQVHEI